MEKDGAEQAEVIPAHTIPEVDGKLPTVRNDFGNWIVFKDVPTWKAGETLPIYKRNEMLSGNSSTIQRLREDLLNGLAFIVPGPVLPMSDELFREKVNQSLIMQLKEACYQEVPATISEAALQIKDEYITDHEKDPYYSGLQEKSTRTIKAYTAVLFTNKNDNFCQFLARSGKDLCEMKYPSKTVFAEEMLTWVNTQKSPNMKQMAVSAVISLMGYFHAKAENHTHALTENYDERNHHDQYKKMCQHSLC